MANGLAPRVVDFKSRVQFLAGCLLAVGLLLGLAEAYLRFFPPIDLWPYLGEKSPATGIYQADPDFGFSYCSWEAFHEQNAERLSAYLPFPQDSSAGTTWAFFGNSFVQAPGMLADHARVSVRDHPIFNLGRNEPLALRFAQIKLLLEHGFRPQRIFVELMPVDVIALGEQPFETQNVNHKGALTYRPHLPGGLARSIIAHSRLGLTAWVRSGRHRGNPNFRATQLYEHVDEPLRSDLGRLFANLARVCREHQIPVTVLLIPAYHQVRFGASCGFQDSLIPMFRQHGFDILDPRKVFRKQPNLDALFLPDRHFTTLGNQVLLDSLLRHLQAQEPLAQAVAP